VTIPLWALVFDSAEKDQVIAEKKHTIAETKQTMAEKDRTIVEKDQVIDHLVKLYRRSLDSFTQLPTSCALPTAAAAQAPVTGRSMSLR